MWFRNPNNEQGKKIPSGVYKTNPKNAVRTFTKKGGIQEDTNIRFIADIKQMDLAITKHKIKSE